MKLGTQTGSVVNHLESRGVIGQPTPVAGMGCTFLGWTDRNPGTIHKVEEYVGHSKHGFFLYCSHDAVTWPPRTAESDAKLAATGDSGLEPIFTPSPPGHIVYKNHKKRGETHFSEWYRVVRNETTGRWNKVNGNGLKIGVRDYYRDPSF